MMALLSAEPVSAYKYVKDSSCSLFELALRGDQGDGWGIGHYSDGELQVYRSEKAIHKDENLDQVIARVSSSLFIAHVRKASNPRGLPRDALISKENSQPFLHRNMLFVHNGTLLVPDEVLGTLGEYRRIIQGVNDSEVLFAYLLKLVNAKGDVEEAFKLLESGLWDIHRSARSSLPAPYRGLNIILSDGRKLYAFEKYVGGSGTSICSRTPVFQMQYRLSGKELVVASEALTADKWEAIPNGALLVAEVIRNEPTYRITMLG